MKITYDTDNEREQQVVLTPAGFDGFTFLVRARVYELVRRVGLDKASGVLVFGEDDACDGEA